MSPESGPHFTDGEGEMMLAFMILLGLLAAAAVTAASVQFRRDGYRRTPTLLR